jgi:cardiolipin synthase
MFYRLRMLVMLRMQQRIGSIVRRREAELYVDGEEAFRRIDELLRGARHTIIIHMFIWVDDPTGRGVALCLVEAADRGVNVHVTKDTAGDMFERNHDFLTTKTDGNPVWQRFWNHPNIYVDVPEECNHGKVYIIDGETMLLGGMNISDEYRYHLHDFLVELRGSRFVEEYLSESPRARSADAVRLVMNSLHHSAVREAIIELIQSAKWEIILEQAYLSDPAMLDLLAQRSLEGIQVRVILPLRTSVHHRANIVAIATLMEQGHGEHMQIFHYPRMLHGKMILVDRDRAFVGSANLMTSSLDAMGEVNVLITGRRHPIVRRARETIRSDILHSIPLQGPPRLRWVTRILAYLGL